MLPLHNQIMLNLSSKIILLATIFICNQSASQNPSILQGKNAIKTQEQSLQEAPRANFVPTTKLKGYWNIDIVGDFEIPKTKSITFCGAGRNLSIKQDWQKIFKRGFTSVDFTRMTPDERNIPESPKPNNWKSRLNPSQRVLWVGANYLANQPFNLQWARNSELADQTLYQDKKSFSSIAAAMKGLGGSCNIFGDCPPNGQACTYSKIFLDIENDGISYFKQQEQANLYIWMVNVLKYYAPNSEIGSIAPQPYNDFGYSRAFAYQAKPSWLWATPAQHTSTSKSRGMTDEILGKTFSQVVDFQMPGTYYFFPDFDYDIPHNQDADRHWLASLLGEQEVNLALSNKKRIAWQWLFNTQSANFNKSGRSEHPAPPAIAEGIGIFYWFTGAYGSILWDDAVDLVPNTKTETDPNKVGTVSDRYYQCYEHYVHGLWRLFKHHGDMFDGNEKYLNQNTECSYDQGKTWWKFNANQLKTRNLAFVRAIVNQDKILIAATKPYAKPNEKTNVKVRYLADGHKFETSINLNGDEIFLGKATLKK